CNPVASYLALHSFPTRRSSDLEAVAALSTSPGDAPSCTYVSAVTRGPVITVGWIGDSRVYWLSADGAVDPGEDGRPGDSAAEGPDRKSTRLNSSHVKISYAVFC